MRNRRSASALARSQSTRQERRTLCIYCEGAVTEPLYLGGLRRELSRHTSNALTIDVRPGKGVPATLVNLATEAKRRGDDYDEFWCVFDVESPSEHPNLVQAINLAEENGIRVAISNPCFEFWLILHYEDHRGFLRNVDARRWLQKRGLLTGKQIDPNDYLGLRDVARGRAAVIAAEHTRHGSMCPDDNPSSGMYLLLGSIERPAD